MAHLVWWGGVFTGISDYLQVSISWSGIFIRLIYMFVICTLHVYTVKCNNDIENILFDGYFVGFILFITLSFNANLSQRLTVDMKAMEVVLIPLQIFLLLHGERQETEYELAGAQTTNNFNFPVTFVFSNMIFVAIFLVCVIPNIELCKNINSYIEQGNYVESVTIFNYPYISIGEKGDVHEWISHFNNEID